MLDHHITVTIEHVDARPRYPIVFVPQSCPMYGTPLLIKPLTSYEGQHSSLIVRLDSTCLESPANSGFLDTGQSISGHGSINLCTARTLEHANPHCTCMLSLTVVNVLAGKEEQAYCAALA